MSDRYLPRPSAPWKRCTRCGVDGPDVVGEPAVCRHTQRCSEASTTFAARPQLVFLPPHLLPVDVDEVET